jgi:lysophospholipase L1-like esterase
MGVKTKTVKRCLMLVTLTSALWVSGAPVQNSPVPPAGYRFDFGPSPAAAGWVQVTPETLYSDDRGFGFEPGSALTGIDRGGDLLTGDFITGSAPFSFSVKVPEGNWRVRITLGDAQGESLTTIKSETRRLMLEKVVTARGEFKTVTLACNVRNRQMTPALPANAPGGSEVRLTNLDANRLNWDDKLTLEFLNDRPCISAIEIVPAPELPTLFLAGDSTVTDQPREPGASWGQMLTAFFKPDIAVANYAASGQTLKSFITDLRLDKLLSRMKAGDWLILQFGHNDEKRNWPQTYVEPFQTHQAYLKVFIAEARLRGAQVILVSPVERRSGLEASTHGDFPASVLEAARAEGVPAIDLWSISRVLYAGMGEDLAQAFGDPTHHRNYGAYELAKCVVQEIKRQGLPLAGHIVEGFGVFDPAHPDPFASFSLRTPVSGNRSAARGNRAFNEISPGRGVRE